MKSPRYSLFAILVVVSPITACSEPFSGSCAESKTCPFVPGGGAGGLGGTEGGGSAGKTQAGNSGSDGSAAGSFGAAGADGNGGSAGGQVDSPIEIISGDLPIAGLNQPYEHRFGVAAQRSATVTWSVAAGALPSGLAISEGGRLHGTPTAEGEFKFDLRVKDDAGKTGTTIVNLRVIKKRWLAHRGQSGGHLYAVELSSALTKSDLTEDVQAPGAALDFWWSSDGSKLACEVRPSADVSSTELRIFDMTTSVPRLERRVVVGEDIQETNLFWAPDMKRLVYAPKGLGDIKYVDLTPMHPSAPKKIALSSNPYGVAWVTSDLIAFPTASGISFATRTDSEWSVQRELAGLSEPLTTAGFSVFKADPLTRTAWYGRYSSDCGGNFALIDFREPRLSALPKSFLMPGSGLDYFVGLEVAKSRMVVHSRASVVSAGTEPFTILGSTSNCFANQWADLEPRFATVNDAGKLIVSTVDRGSVISQVVPGVYPKVDGIPQLSRDGSALVFTATSTWSEAYLARIVAGVPQSAFKANGTPKANVSGVRLAPNGSAVVYCARQDSDKLEVYLTSAPGTPRNLSSSVVGFSEALASDSTWSSDSSYVVFNAYLTTGGRHSYLVNAVDPNKKAVKFGDDSERYRLQP
jgi:Tol biopolymer transport system component